jgi:hypothetical protein
MSWKHKLLQMDTQVAEDLDTLMVQSTEAKNHDVGIINPTSGVGLLARENGRIEAFSDYGLGFRIDPVTQSFSIYAPTIRMFAEKVESHTEEKPVSYIKGEYKEVLDLLGGTS